MTHLREPIKHIVTFGALVTASTALCMCRQSHGAPEWEVDLGDLSFYLPQSLHNYSVAMCTSRQTRGTLLFVFRS
jgi:hypothetical protein